MKYLTFPAIHGFNPTRYISIYYDDSSPKSLRSILGEVYSAIDSAEVAVFPDPQIKSIEDTRAFLLDHFSRLAMLERLQVGIGLALKKIWTPKELEIREAELSNIARYLKLIEPIVEQLNISNCDRYRMVYYLARAKGLAYIVGLLATVEGVRSFIERGNIKAEDLIRLSGCVNNWDDNDIFNRFLKGCPTIATYDQDTRIVTIHCESQRKRGRYKQIIGVVNKVLKFKRIELIL